MPFSLPSLFCLPASRGREYTIGLICGTPDADLAGVTENLPVDDEIDLTPENIGRAVDGWYRDLLVIVDLELDVALVRMAAIQARIMAVRTKAMRSGSRVITSAASREIDPLLQTLSDQARLLQRASAIRRMG
jgi:hypothetical protein